MTSSSRTIHPPLRPVRPRSTHELRLEQIAIWGDAAEYSSRHSPKRSTNWRSHRRSTKGSLAPVSGPTSSSTPSSSSASTSVRHVNIKRDYPDLQNRHTQPLDVEQLENSLTDVLQLPPRRGSMSLCNSRSAEAFRRSGTYAVRARNNATETGNTNQPNLPDVERIDMESDHIVLTKRNTVSSTSFFKFSKDLKYDHYFDEHEHDRPLFPTDDNVEDGDDDDDDNGDEEHTSKKVDNKPTQIDPNGIIKDLPLKQSNTSRVARFFGVNEHRSNRQNLFGKSLFPLSPASPSVTPSTSAAATQQRRERDENDFKLSNAKLPERNDDSQSSSLFSTLRPRSRNFPPTTFGRYSRSRISRLPNPVERSRGGLKLDPHD